MKIMLVLLQAARALEDETEKRIALQEMQRALRYLKILEPKFKRYEREIAKQTKSPP